MAHYDCDTCGAGIWEDHSESCKDVLEQEHREKCGSGFPFRLPMPTRPAPPMPTIKDPLVGLRSKYIAYGERLKEIHEAIGRYLEAGKVIPQEWIDEFSMLNSEF